MDTFMNLQAAFLLFLQENIRTPLLTAILEFMTNLGNAGFIWIISSLLLMIFKKTRAVGVCALVSLLLSLLFTNLILKNLFQEPRPFVTYPEINPPHLPCFLRILRLPLRPRLRLLRGGPPVLQIPVPPPGNRRPPCGLPHRLFPPLPGRPLPHGHPGRSRRRRLCRLSSAPYSQTILEKSGPIKKTVKKWYPFLHSLF